MNAGILRDKIEIYEPVIVKTDFGSNKNSWKLFCTTRAKVDYGSGGRSNENNEIVYNNTYTFIVRHYVQVKEIMQIKFNDNMYRIISIKPNKYYNDKEIVAELVNK